MPRGDIQVSPLDSVDRATHQIDETIPAVANPIGPDIDPLVTVKLRVMEFSFVTPGLAGICTLSQRIA